MKKHFYTNLSFQILVTITLGLCISAVIQYGYSEMIIEESILTGTKQQAYTYLLGIERQIQSLPDPFNKEELVRVFTSARHHDILSLNFAIINIYMFDRAGKVVAYLDEPEILRKDLDGYYGEVFRSQKPYFGEEIETHHSDSQGNSIRSTDIITPVHFHDKIIGGLEVEIDLNKTFSLIKQMDNRYESQISAMLCTMLIFLTLFIWGILHLRMIKPVRKIGQTTSQIADGNLQARVEVESADEIGGLAESVNKMAHNLEKLFHELDETYMGTLNALTRALEAKDDYTASHSVNVTRYALDLGRHMGLNIRDLETLKQGAMLHDLGKIGIPDKILNKSDGLNGEEREIIQQHPQLTSAILDPLEKFKHFSDIARFHHERWDGRGYPDGLAGEDIPLLARIVAITDTWDAMTSDRVYRKGMNRKEALQALEVERDNGQWDPQLVDHFVRMIRENNMVHSSAKCTME